MPVNYQLGKIYKLSSPNTEFYFIGSTCVDLNRRLISHKRKYKEFLEDPKIYTQDFEILKNGDCKIELIEEYPCLNKRELTNREKWHNQDINCLKSNLKRSELKEYYKSYYQMNKSMIREKQKTKYR